MKNRCARRDKYLIFYRATCDVRIRSDQAVITNPSRMTRGAPDHCILKHDAMRANLNRAALGHETCPKHNPAMRADKNVTAHGRGRSDISRWINSRFLSTVAKNHDGSANDASFVAAFIATGCVADLALAYRQWAKATTLPR